MTTHEEQDELIFKKRKKTTRNSELKKIRMSVDFEVEIWSKHVFKCKWQKIQGRGRTPLILRATTCDQIFSFRPISTNRDVDDLDILLWLFLVPRHLCILNAVYHVKSLARPSEDCMLLV